MSPATNQRPNPRGAENTAIQVLFHAGPQWRGVSDPER
jgi:hypothetical protein